MRLRNVPGAREVMIENKYVFTEPEGMKGTWKDVFGNSNPVHIEIGMGKGVFITTLASQNPDIMGDVLDMAFNTENKELVVILSNGQIMFCHEKYCRFHSAVDMITNFNVDAYDFRGCICSESITNQIRQNGGLIDKVFHPFSHNCCSY